MTESLVSWITSLVRSFLSLGQDYAEVLVILTVFSVVTVVLLFFFGARLIAELPTDYFLNDKRQVARYFWGRYPPPVRILFLVVKNFIGAGLFIVGLALLVLPGQGLLTMLAGVVFMDFPGKYACERWLVRRRGVLRSLNWLRERKGKPPLEVHGPPP